MRAWPPQLTGPFTRAEGLRAGLTDADLRGPACVRLFHSMYVPASITLTPMLRARAALTIAPAGAVAARQTAAALWGGVAPATSDVHLTLRPGTRMRVDGIDARARRTVEVGLRGGVLLTSPAQTFVDLAPELDLVDLVVLGDSLVRVAATTPEQLVVRADAEHGSASRGLRQAAAHVRAGVDSPMESRLRMLIVLAGLPEPLVNHAIREETGRVRYRLDLAYPLWRIAIEYDGRQHAENGAQWRWDVYRREELESDGWRLVVVLGRDLYGSPQRILDRVVRAAADHDVTLATRSDAWRRYFPARD